MKKHLYKTGKFLAICLLCFSIVVGCNRTQPNSKTTSSNTNQPGRIVIGTTLKPRTLDPADTYEIAGLNILYNVCESLYTYELSSTKLKPLLAKEMPKISPDGLTYTIALREGVTFHDGSAFNAKTMDFSLNRFLTNGGKPSFLLTDIIKSHQATGDYELTINLKKPFAAFSSLLAFPGACAVSPKAYKIGTGEFNPNQIVATGPYKLAQFTSDGIRLDVFDGYWGEKPANPGVNLQIFASNSANLFNSFRTQAIDVAYQSLDPEQIKSLTVGATAKKWQIIEAPGTAVNYLVLNRRQQPLDKLEVRQAIAALIDRNLLNQRVLQGQGEPVYSLIPTAFNEYKPVFKDAYGDGNFAKAKELLEKAGYSANNPATVEIWHSSGSATRGIVASTLKALADKELGGMIDFKPNSVEFATASKQLSLGIYPSFLADWYPDFLDADNYIQPFLACEKGSVATGCDQGSSQTQGSFYYSDLVNQLITQQRQEQKPEARKVIFAKIQDILAKDVPYVPLWQTKDYVFAKNGLQGVIINPSQNFPFWTIKASS